LITAKDELRKKFSADYKRYYFVELFEREGFTRKKCESCGRFFWTLDSSRNRCDDQPCSPYRFIGNPPTSKKFDRISAWREIEDFFVKNGHTSIKRYPVVSRWRPDLYFTIASIIDFQRIEGGKVVFQFPANPLIVPQVCLRFNDIPSVGVSGKHFTSFVMVGQHSVANKNGYWKDRCIELDFGLLTERFGIKPEEITFKEDVWLGYGAFGYSLEYFVRGLELGNAVFTAFEGEVDNYRPMKQKVIDMGAGLERFVWLSQGTPTSYDANFDYAVNKMVELSGIEVDTELLQKYASYAGKMNQEEFGSITAQRKAIAREIGVKEEELNKGLGPLESIYAIADHAQTLLFAISDGMLPSNSGGGYNLRVIFRRALNMIRRYSLNFGIEDIVELHIKYLKSMFEELKDHYEDVKKVLEVERIRYEASYDRAKKIISSIVSAGREVTAEEMVKLYESDGITPEQLVEAGVKVQSPEDFYTKLQEKHGVKRIEEEKKRIEIPNLSPTRLLFYEDEDIFDFEAKVLEVLEGKFVILDKTAFYPRGGGQEPDRGYIGSARVTDVEKYGSIVLHKVEGEVPKKNSLVSCRVDKQRRKRITVIHTATHILNGSSRQVLGSWVWQHSAFKEENYGRLDITHFSHLTKEEVRNIERVANDIVRKNLPVSARFMSRKVAEERYGFRLYQGGVVPSRNLRIVNIGDWDIEACGGTHTKTTGEVGLIKITKVERVQDGVERIEFVAGESALEYINKLEDEVENIISALGTQSDKIVDAVSSNISKMKKLEQENKKLVDKLTELRSEIVLKNAKQFGEVKLYANVEKESTEKELISLGEKAVRKEPSLVFVVVMEKEGSIKIIAFSGQEARKKGISAVSLVKLASSIVEGAGGGDEYFAQGGGQKKVVPNEILKAVESFVEERVKV
jgi:alanyl-tRNA synthetase